MPVRAFVVIVVVPALWVCSDGGRGCLALFLRRSRIFFLTSMTSGSSGGSELLSFRSLDHCLPSFWHWPRFFGCGIRVAGQVVRAASALPRPCFPPPTDLSQTGHQYRPCLSAVSDGATLPPPRGGFLGSGGGIAVPDVAGASTAVAAAGRDEAPPGSAAAGSGICESTDCQIRTLCPGHLRRRHCLQRQRWPWPPLPQPAAASGLLPLAEQALRPLRGQTFCGGRRHPRRRFCAGADLGAQDRHAVCGCDLAAYGCIHGCAVCCPRSQRVDVKELLSTED